MQSIWQSLKSITFGALSLGVMPVMALDAVDLTALDSALGPIYRICATATTMHSSYQSPQLAWPAVDVIVPEAFDHDKLAHDLGGVRLHTAGFWAANHPQPQKLQGFQVYVVDRTIHHVDIIKTDLATLQTYPSSSKKRLFVKEGSRNGNGSFSHPFGRMSDALAVVNDLDTIYILNS